MIELKNTTTTIYEHDGTICKISINRDEQTDKTMLQLGRGRVVQSPYRPFMEVGYKGNTIYIH